MTTTTGGGGYTSRKFITEELLVKLNTLLEQLVRQQPPIDRTVEAYKQETDKVQYYLNELKKKPDDPYLRAQLYQAMDDERQLYNLYQGKRTRLKLKPGPLQKAHKPSHRNSLQSALSLMCWLTWRN